MRLLDTINIGTLTEVYANEIKDVVAEALNAADPSDALQEIVEGHEFVIYEANALLVLLASNHNAFELAIDMGFDPKDYSQLAFCVMWQDAQDMLCDALDEIEAA